MFVWSPAADSDELTLFLTNAPVSLPFLALTLNELQLNETWTFRHKLHKIRNILDLGHIQVACVIFENICDARVH